MEIDMQHANTLQQDARQTMIIDDDDSPHSSSMRTTRGAVKMQRNDGTDRSQQ